METKAVGERLNPIQYILFYAVILFGAFISLYRFYWMVVISSSERTAAFSMPPKWLIGDQFVGNITKAFGRNDFFRLIRIKPLSFQLWLVNAVFFG